MTVTTRKQVDWHARNAMGTTLCTFDNEDLAKSWVRRHIERFPSLRVEKVTLRVETEVVFRPRVRLARKQEIAA